MIGLHFAKPVFHVRCLPYWCGVERGGAAEGSAEGGNAVESGAEGGGTEGGDAVEGNAEGGDAEGRQC